MSKLFLTLCAGFGICMAPESSDWWSEMTYSSVAENCKVCLEINTEVLKQLFDLSSEIQNKVTAFLHTDESMQVYYRKVEHERKTARAEIDKSLRKIAAERDARRERIKAIFHNSDEFDD